MPFLQRQINHLTQENGKNWISWKAIFFPFSSHLHVTCTNFWFSALFLVNQFREEKPSKVVQRELLETQRLLVYVHSKLGKGMC